MNKLELRSLLADRSVDTPTGRIVRVLSERGALSAAQISRLTGLAAELDALRRYHRQTLQELPMGVCSLAKDQEILMWNKAMEELTGIAAKHVVGSRLVTIDEPWRGLLQGFINVPDEHLHKQRLNLGQGGLGQAEDIGKQRRLGHGLAIMRHSETSGEWIFCSCERGRAFASAGQLNFK